jgi:hypothetical protein
MVFLDESVFISLHQWACRVLADDPANTKAKTFLKEQLGSCHELLRKCLRHVTLGEIFAPPGQAVRAVNHCMEELVSPGSFLQRFVMCLAPVLIDRETMSLVRRARDIILHHFLHAMSSQEILLEMNAHELNNIYCTADILECMENWRDMHLESDQARWKKFHDLYLSGAPVSLKAKTAQPKETTKSIQAGGKRPVEQFKRWVKCVPIALFWRRL